MATTVPINLTLDDTTPTAVAITAILRGDTGLAPSGLSLPVTLAPGSPVGGNVTWAGDFVDPADLPASTYTITFTTTYADGAVIPDSFVLDYSSDPLVGYYWSQAAATALFGQYNLAAESQLNNDSAALNPATLAAYGAMVDNLINRKLRDNYYAAPLPTTSADMPVFLDLGNRLLGIKLYRARPQPGDAGMEAKVNSVEAEVTAQLDNMLWGGGPGIDCPRAGGYATAPVAASANVMPNGLPVWRGGYGWMGYGGQVMFIR